MPSVAWGGGAAHCGILGYARGLLLLFVLFLLLCALCAPQVLFGWPAFHFSDQSILFKKQNTQNNSSATLCSGCFTCTCQEENQVYLYKQPRRRRSAPASLSNILYPDTSELITAATYSIVAHKCQCISSVSLVCIVVYSTAGAHQLG